MGLIAFFNGKLKKLLDLFSGKFKQFRFVLPVYSGSELNK